MQIRGVDDARDFQTVKQAMFALGFDQNTIDQYFSLLSGILHLGNITFKDSGETVRSIIPALSHRLFWMACNPPRKS